MRAEEPAQFLNVDLDVYSRRPLGDLAAAMGRSVATLYVGKFRSGYSAHLELWGSGYGQTPDKIIVAFVRLVAKLPRA